jgi:beta-N-acetylhexosaminidase
MNSTSSPRAIIFGCAGAELTPAEANLFRQTNPLGFILFGRNCADPEQIKALVSDLRETVGRTDAPVLIDQEGGRVARLKPPHWPVYFAARTIGEIAVRNRQKGVEAARLNSMLIGADLRDLGVTVNCAPTLDLLVPGAHDMIGTRSYGTDPKLVAELGAAACDGFLSVNVIPVIKHLPGYGRALVDSHETLPSINESVDVLDSTDFVTFRLLADMPWGMSAHALYTAIDAECAATVSTTVIGQIIRGRIGFDGILVTDDLSMGALAGPLTWRVRASLEAGCDVALHCNGNLEEMTAMAEVAPSLPHTTVERIDHAERRRKSCDSEPTFERADVTRRLKSLLAD